MVPPTGHPALMHGSISAGGNVANCASLNGAVAISQTERLLRVADLKDGCPKCGETMVPAVAGNKPCTVLDPFGGAGTMGLVADRLQCNAVLIELNPDDATMADRRIKDDAPLFAAI